MLITKLRRDMKLTQPIRLIADSKAYLDSDNSLRDSTSLQRLHEARPLLAI